MKKIMICALAVGMFTACSQEETLSTQAPLQISFANAYVNNATRAAIDPSFSINGANGTTKLVGFDVWGFMDETSGVVFNGEDVTGGDGAWTYSNTQYWAPNHTYYFGALAPMNSKNIGYNSTDGSAGKFGLGNVHFVNENGTEDLIYAAATKTTPAEITSDPGAVKLEFNHLLSKVKFSFTNGFNNDNAFITVKNIRMTAPKEATINLNQENWWSSNEDGKGWALWGQSPDITLDFGDMETPKVAEGKSSESTYERFTFPAKGTREYIVTFDVELYMGDQLAYSNNLMTKISGAELFMGKAYNFHAEINADNIVPGDDPNAKLYPIEFTATVKDWDNNNGDEYVYDGEDIKTYTAIATEKELAAAAAAGGKFTLASDITLTSTLAVSENMTLKLNGKTLKNKIDNAKTDVIVVAENATLTIEGEGTVEAVTGNDGYAVIADGTVIINGGTFKAGKDAEGAANAVVYVRGNGKAYVNGGEFPNENNSAYVLNKKDADRATTTIEVKGGTFTGFNPANNAAEGAGTNFVVEGYESVENPTGVWTVQAKANN